LHAFGYGEGGEVLDEDDGGGGLEAEWVAKDKGEHEGAGW